MKQSINGVIGDNDVISGTISAVTGDLKSKREMTAKGLLCKDSVIAIAPQVRDYMPSELGITGWKKPTIKIYTPPEVLFTPSVMENIDDAVDNHPEGIIVTPDNWEKHSIGSAKNIRKVGDELQADLLIKDKKAIKLIEENKKVGLSLGYSFEAMIESGNTSEGVEYDAIITSMVGDHVALVQSGRGGFRVRIGDEKTKGNTKMIKVMINGQEWEVDVANADAFKKALEDQSSALETAQSLANSEITIGDKVYKASDSVGIKAAFDSLAEEGKKLANEKAELEKTLIKPEDVEKLANERSETVADAKILKPDLQDKGKSVEEIKTEIVEANIGDVSVLAILKGAKIGDALPDQIDIAFRVLSAKKSENKDVQGSLGDSQNQGPSSTSSALDSLNNSAMVQDAKTIAMNMKANAYKGVQK